MKKLLIVLLCLTLYMKNAQALNGVPAMIINDNIEIEAIEFKDGEYVLPEICSTSGCTIIVDEHSLKAIGKYQFESREEYFYVSEGNGATIYEEDGDNSTKSQEYEENFNKIIIDPIKFKESGFITVKMGSGEETRTVKLIPNQGIGQVTPIDDIKITPIDENIDITTTDETITTNKNKARKPYNKNTIIYIMVGLGVMLIVSSSLLLFKRKKTFE